MRTKEFPFAKYRDWGPTPLERPELDAERIADLTAWQDGLYRRPILDDITGYYQFNPSPNGAASYATRAAAKRPVLPEKIEEGDTYEAKSERQILHIAERAELATALFWAAAVMRHEVVGRAIGHIVDAAEAYQNKLRIPEKIAAYSADAIADYGYCLVHPVDIDFKGENHGEALALQIERVAAGVGQSLLEFGKYAVDNPQAMQSFDGVVALQATLIEQERRYNHWAPRHISVTEAFPALVPSNEVVNLSIDFPELFWLHEQVKVSA